MNIKILVKRLLASVILVTLAFLGCVGPFNHGDNSDNPPPPADNFCS